jgi:hypothetical protein
MAAEPSEIQALQIKLICRLFWLIRTNISAANKFPEDVKLFSDAEVLVGIRSEASAEAIQRSYGVIK